MEEIESCGEKCANLCRVYKLIMVSRVPGYGHLEYLVLGLSCESHHHVTLINFVGLMMILWLSRHPLVQDSLRDHKIIHARNFRVQPQAIMGSSIVE